MFRPRTYILPLIAAFCLTACDTLMRNFINPDDYDFLNELTDKPKQAMEVTGVQFAPDYKTFTISTNMVHEVSEYELADSTHIRVEVVETIDGIRHTHLTTPKLVKIHNTEAEGLIANKVYMLVLVDLTAPQTTLDQIRAFVGNMRTIFVQDNLFVAFMDSTGLSRTMPATDYLLANHFKHSNAQRIYLYRSMVQVMEQMNGHKDVWKEAEKLVMVTFASDAVYDDDTDMPFDPEHYNYEQRLLQPRTDNSFIAYYASLTPPDEMDDVHAMNVPRLFCNNTGGAYIQDFTKLDAVLVKKKVYEALQLNFPDNQFDFVNPDYKVYRGDIKELTINFYDIQKDSLIASTSTTVKLGQIYKPIIVHGHAIRFVIIQGIVLGLFILVMLYLLLQFIIPSIRYLIFKHKYVITYTGSNMSVGQKTVAESCYLCKAPFNPGDEVVVKCEHTMHHSCWIENGYHCTEYSDRCKHGSHYYNIYNPFDLHNASFYLPWLLMATVVAVCSWICFIINMNYEIDFVTERFMRPPASQMPSFGFTLGLFLTAGISALAVTDNGWRYALQIVLRSLAGAIGCYLIFLLTNVAILLLDINILVELINVIPWAVSSLIIIFCATNVTRIVYNRRLVFISLGLGVLSMLVLGVFYNRSELDYRVLILVSFVIYCCCMAVSVASAAPRSERYFLKVEGAVKTMDIALYKWFRNNAGRVVTIGKSVDCSLQLSWDVQSAIAPVQAEIRLVRNTPCLFALEPGVFIHGKALRTGKKVRLYHGCSFAIGQTTFTYLEKDR